MKSRSSHPHRDDLDDLDEHVFGLAKLATKNLPGAMIVGGGALVKTLYDRRKSRGGQRREGDRELIEQARGED